MLNDEEAKMSYQPVSQREEQIAKAIVDAAFKVHSSIGPGLIEPIYEVCFCHELNKRGLSFQRQMNVPIIYDGIKLDAALRLDVLVEDLVICELKAVERVIPLFEAQLLSYMKLLNKRLGFLINFHVPVIKDGIQRMIL
jgi:GxxExxY protein